MDSIYFDENNMARIKALMKVKGHALSYNIGNINSYFSHFSNVVDIPLSYIINDEISNSLHRGPITQLLTECLACQDDEISTSVMDMKDLFVNRADFLVGSLLLDFNVNAFSTFERWMCSAYDFIKPKYQSSNTKKKKLIKYIKKYNLTVSMEVNDETKTNPVENEATNDHVENERNLILSKIMNECSNYESSMEKIKFVLKKVAEKYEPYKTRKQDLELIEFLSKVRNTVHTGGFNLTNNNYSITISDEVYTLNSGEGFKSKNHAQSIILWNKIIDIYTYVYVFINENFPQKSYDGILYNVVLEDDE